DLPDPGGLRARPLQPAADPHSGRRIAAALVHADRVRRDDGGPDPPVPGLHGPDPDARDAPVLPVWGPLPAQRPARLAQRADPDRPAYLRGRADAARGLQSSELSASLQQAAGAEHYLGRLASPAVAVTGNGGGNGPGIDDHRNRGVQQDRIGSPARFLRKPRANI